MPKLIQYRYILYGVALAFGANVAEAQTPAAAGTTPAAIKFDSASNHPTPNVATGPSAAAPAAARGGGVPANLQGVVTAEEFQKYLAFQQQLRSDPGIKEVNDRIMQHVQELQKLQTSLNRLRDAALAANPDAKAISDRIQDALTAASRKPLAPK